MIAIIKGENQDKRILDDISDMSIGLINMLQSISKTIFSLAQVVDNLEPLLENGILEMIKDILNIKDYEI